jgi:hypothetical protein
MSIDGYVSPEMSYLLVPLESLILVSSLPENMGNGNGPALLLTYEENRDIGP